MIQDADPTTTQTPVPTEPVPVDAAPTDVTTDLLAIDPSTIFQDGSVNTDALVEQLTPVGVALGSRLLGVIVLLLIAWMIARWVKRLVRGSLTRARMEETISRFAGTVASTGVMLIAFIVSLSVFGVETTTFAALLGGLGLALGLGFQGALSNLAAGVMLLIFRPFRVGEFVRIDDQEGEVEEIELYFTRINTLDRRHIMVPNQQVLDNIVTNLSRNKTIRLDIPIGVTYQTNPRATRAALESAIPKIQGVDQSQPNSPVLVGFGDSSVDWELRVFCNWRDRIEVQERTFAAIWDALDEAGIEIPFPQRDLHLKTPVNLEPARG